MHRSRWIEIGAALSLTVWGAITACSASEAPSGRGKPGSAGSSQGTGGRVSLSGGTSSTLGSGGATDTPVVHTECSSDQGCKAGEVCVKPGPDSGISGPGECAPNKGPCGANDTCAEDTFCCGEGCRLAGSEKVCIPFDFGTSPECKLPGGVGVFSPAVQCEWVAAADDPSKYVLATPLVADLPTDSGASAEIVFTTWFGDDASSSAPGRLRIISGQTCELKETVLDSFDKVRANTPLALADLDNSGSIDIVSRLNAGGLIAFHWNGTKFVKLWETPAEMPQAQTWDGPSIHDLNNDGKPEVLLQDAVYNGQTGALIAAGGNINQPFNGYLPVAGDLNGDGVVELVTSRSYEVTFLSWIDNQWQNKGLIEGKGFGYVSSHYAIADFGTPGSGAFDLTKFDGQAEIVSVESLDGGVKIAALNHQILLDIPPPTAGGDPKAAGVFARGGPPTIGDFDNDGQPEVAIAGKLEIAVFDPGCTGPGNGCAEKFIRWRKPTQDASSAQTGVALFDFEGDGKAEVVYADECFVRVYQGDTGDVLFSAFRNSATWYESPVVADVDKDQSSEIVVNSAYPVPCPGTPDWKAGVPFVDPQHPGVRCGENSDCVPGNKCEAGFCRCANDTECDAGLSCQPPISGGGANVCRATHPNKLDTPGGIRVLRDRLDRTASSRPLWNQHAYSITNVNDDGKIPKTSEWLLNWRQKGMNNYRQNTQGSAGFADAPDITGKLDTNELCIVQGDVITLTGKVCNRGNKAVGADMPATFYDQAGKVLCVSRTTAPVGGKGDCKPVSCTIKERVSGKITMKVNDDAGGGQTAKECNPNNNTDAVSLESCVVK